MMSLPKSHALPLRMLDRAERAAPSEPAEPESKKSVCIYYGIEDDENKLNVHVVESIAGHVPIFSGQAELGKLRALQKPPRQSKGGKPIIEKLYTAKEEPLALLQTFLAYTEEKKCTEVFFASHGGLDAQRRVVFYLAGDTTIGYDTIHTLFAPSEQTLHFASCLCPLAGWANVGLCYNSILNPGTSLAGPGWLQYASVADRRGEAYLLAHSAYHEQYVHTKGDFTKIPRKIFTDLEKVVGPLGFVSWSDEGPVRHAFKPSEDDEKKPKKD
jgi:hypothetical protein